MPLENSGDGGFCHHTSGFLVGSRVRRPEWQWCRSSHGLGDNLEEIGAASGGGAKAVQ